MATIAEQLIGIASETAKAAPDVGGALAKGAQLGMQAEQIRQQRMALEQKKTQNELAKYSKIADIIKIADKTKDANLQKALFQNAIPNAVTALGADDVFTPQSLELMSKSPDVRAKVLGLGLEAQNRIAQGEDPAAVLSEIKGILGGDEISFATLDTDKIYKAREFAIAEQGRETRSIRETAAGFDRQGRQPTIAQETDVRKAFDKFKLDGGEAGFEASIKALEGVAEGLETGKVKTRNFSSFVPFLGTNQRFQSLVNPTKEAFKNDAEAILEKSLRLTLGAQFTEGEGKRLLARIWDDAQPAEENARRIRNEIARLQNDFSKRMELFGQQGLIKPRKEGSGELKLTPPASKKTSSFKPTADQIKMFQAEPEKQEQRAQALAKQFGMTAEEIKKALGVK